MKVAMMLCSVLGNGWAEVTLVLPDGTERLSEVPVASIRGLVDQLLGDVTFVPAPNLEVMVVTHYDEAQIQADLLQDAVGELASVELPPASATMTTPSSLEQGGRCALARLNNAYDDYVNSKFPVELATGVELPPPEVGDLEELPAPSAPTPALAPALKPLGSAKAAKAVKVAKVPKADKAEAELTDDQRLCRAAVQAMTAPRVGRELGVKQSVVAKWAAGHGSVLEAHRPRLRELLEQAATEAAEGAEDEAPGQAAASAEELAERRKLAQDCIRAVGATAVGQALGVSASAVKNWASGHRAVTAERAKQLGRVKREAGQLARRDTVAPATLEERVMAQGAEE